MYSVEEIRENYKGISDSKIENIALNESKGLRKEILGILKEEIKKRNLGESLITWLDAEINTLTDFERLSLIRKIENLKCPNCGQRESKLIGQEFSDVGSSDLREKTFSMPYVTTNNDDDNNNHNSHTSNSDDYIDPNLLVASSPREDHWPGRNIRCCFDTIWMGSGGHSVIITLTLTIS